MQIIRSSLLSQVCMAVGAHPACCMMSPIRIWIPRLVYPSNAAAVPSIQVRAAQLGSSKEPSLGCNMPRGKYRHRRHHHRQQICPSEYPCRHYRPSHSLAAAGPVHPVQHLPRTVGAIAQHLRQKTKIGPAGPRDGLGSGVKRVWIKCWGRTIRRIQSRKSRSSIAESVRVYFNLLLHCLGIFTPS